MRLSAKTKRSSGLSLAWMGLAVVSMAVWAGTASATPIADFEGTGLSEGTVLTNQIAGLSITGGELTREGAPQFGFASQYGADTVSTGAPFDHDFLSPTTSAVDHIVRIAFDTPISSLAFTLGDIDPSTIVPLEAVEITAYNSSNVPLHTLTVQTDDPDTGDGHGTLVQFAALDIAAIEITNLVPAAYGIDNILVPEPTTALLVLGGLAGLAARRRRLN